MPGAKLLLFLTGFQEQVTNDSRFHDFVNTEQENLHLKSRPISLTAGGDGFRGEGLLFPGWNS